MSTLPGDLFAWHACPGCGRKLFKFYSDDSSVVVEAKCPNCGHIWRALIPPPSKI